MVSVIIAAGGKGTRMGADINKVYLKLSGKEILVHTIEAFQQNKNVDEVIVVTGECDIEKCKTLAQKHNLTKVSAIVCGGDTRQKSVYNGIIASKGDIVAIHDGARALISQEEINAVIADCKKYGAAALGVKVKDTLKASDDGFISKTVDRSNMYAIHTPQVFAREDIIKAHQAAQNPDATDDCGLIENIGIRIKITEGSYNNIKITTPEDIIMAEAILKGRNI